MSDFVHSPMDFEAPGNYKGGPGKYDGEGDSTFPPRTKDPNGVPEKFYEGGLDETPAPGGDGGLVYSPFDIPR